MFFLPINILVTVEYKNVRDFVLQAEEELDEEERKEAWKEYEDERMGRKMYMNNFNNQNYLTQQYNEMLHANQAEIANRATLSGINIENLEALIRKDVRIVIIYTVIFENCLGFIIKLFIYIISLY